MSKGYENPQVAEEQRRIRYLEQMPGYNIKQELNALNLASWIMSENVQQIDRCLREFIGTGKIVHELPETYSSELSRLLLNFLASVGSMRDVQLRLVHKYWGKDSDFDIRIYRPKVADLFGSGPAKFLIDLRNYVIHRGAPEAHLGSKLIMEQGQPLRHLNSVHYKKSELLAWGKWTGPSKAYLSSLSEEFDLAEPIEHYSNAAREFFGWFWNEFIEEHSSVREQYLTRAAEFWAWYEEKNVVPDWVRQPGGEPPSDWKGKWSMFHLRAQKRAARFKLGTAGFQPFTVDSNGEVAAPESDGWGPFPDYDR